MGADGKWEKLLTQCIPTPGDAPLGYATAYGYTKSVCVVFSTTESLCWEKLHLQISVQQVSV